MKSTFLALALTGTSARMSFGECPKDVENVTNLDKARYSGMWYEIEKDMSFPMTMGADCTYKNFTVDSNGDLDLWFGAYYWPAFSYNGVGGTMYCTAGNKETCEATMTGTGAKREAFPVLATDYETYDIGYYCMDMIKGFMKADFVMIYGREKTMSAEKLEEVRNIIRAKIPEYGYDFQMKSWNTHGETCEYEKVSTYF